MEPIVAKENILKYIPQRPPMVMVDMLQSSTLKSATSGFKIREDNIFLKEDKLDSPGLIENIAQTAAASAGYYFKKNDLPVKVGFIGSIKKLQIHAWPKVGDELITTIEEINEVMNVKIIEGSISSNGKAIASCEMKIFLMDAT